MDVDELDRIYSQIGKKKGIKIIKNLGKGGFGIVKEIEIKKKIYAAKLIKKEGKYDESDIIKELKGPNIVKIIKIEEEKDKENNTYHLIVMEKANLKSLNIFIYHLHNNNMLNYIFKKPFEIIGDNLLRFFIKQLVKGLEIVNISGYSHFDIKPGNILLFLNMILKLTDFGLLTKVVDNKEEKDEEKEVHIPGGTRGYLTPEFYHSKERLVSPEVAMKQDYFALGATIFYIKYGKEMLEYYPFADYTKNSDIIVNLLERAMDKIKSTYGCDEGFIQFLCSLIQYKPEERPNFERIIRNQWLNGNSKEIKRIYDINENDEKKLIIELDKSDFLLEKEKKIQNNYRGRHKFIFKYNN